MLFRVRLVFTEFSRTLTDPRKLGPRFGERQPVYSAGKVVMTLRGKRTGPKSYEGSATGPGGTSTSKTILNADGKTMTIDGMTGPIASHVVFDRVK